MHTALAQLGPLLVTLVYLGLTTLAALEERAQNRRPPQARSDSHAEYLNALKAAGHPLYSTGPNADCHSPRCPFTRHLTPTAPFPYCPITGCPHALAPARRRPTPPTITAQARPRPSAAPNVRPARPADPALPTTPGADPPTPPDHRDHPEPGPVHAPWPCPDAPPDAA